MSINRCVFMGYLGSDPDLRYTQTQMAVASASLALSRGKDRNGNDRGTDWIRCKAFGRTAEVMQQYTRKGDKVGLECHVQTGSYQDRDGKTVYTTDFIIDRLELAGGGRNSQPPQQGTYAPQTETYAQAAPAAQPQPFHVPEGFTEVSDADIPF